MNQNLLNKFIDIMNGGSVLELGLKQKDINAIKTKCEVHSFDITTSALKFNKDGLFKQNALVRLPFKDGQYDGVVSYKIIGYGDSKFLFNELRRVSNGIVMICEDDIDSLPLDYFTTIDDMYVISASTDGEIMDIDDTFIEFFSRKDLKRLFHRPGSSLNKFNLLIPEDIKSDIAVLCNKTAMVNGK